MSWSKSSLPGAAIVLFSCAASAEKITCPESLQVSNRIYKMSEVDLFQGPPEKQGTLMPDTLDDMVWTLKDYQDYAKKMNMPLYLVCRYKGTEKVVTLRVPAAAKKCSSWNSNSNTYAACE